MISSMSVPICNRFHVTRANSGKITFFRVPLFDALVREKNLHPGAQNFVVKLRVFDAAHSENFVILACTVLTQYRSVTDGRTDGQTPRQ